MAFLALNNERLTAVRLRMPARGAWVAEVDFESDPEVPDRCTLQVGSLTLSGTVHGLQSGVFGKQRKLRLVAGGGGWGTLAPPKAYHNDAGVKAQLLAEDLAREAGEQLGGFAPAAERLGVDFVRNEGVSCATILETVIGAVSWWVDAAGVTHVGERPTAPALVSDAYQVLAYDPRERVVTLSLTDPSVLAIGSVIAGPSLPEPQTVHEFQVQADASGVRVFAWCGADSRSAGRLSALWRAVTARATEQLLLGLYLYRVVRMAPGSQNRVSLQAVHRDSGLPDIEPITQWPGVPGLQTDLAPGAQVLVAFIEGDRTQPVVTHYAGAAGEGFVPTGIVIGGPTGQPCARQGDQVTVLLPPMVFVGTMTIPGSPPAALTGTVSPTLQQATGLITTGSPIVKVAP